MTTIAVHRDEDDPILFVERNERVEEYEELPENSVKYVRRSASQRLDIPRFRIRFEQDDEGGSINWGQRDGTICELLMNDGQTRCGRPFKMLIEREAVSCAR